MLEDPVPINDLPVFDETDEGNDLGQAYLPLQYGSENFRVPLKPVSPRRLPTHTHTISQVVGLQPRLGFQTFTKTAHGFLKGSSVKFVGGVWALAQADTIEHAEGVGLVSNVVDANNFEVTMQGVVEIAGVGCLYSSLTPGESYYLSVDTAGIATTIMPSEGQVFKPVFLALTETTALIISQRAFTLGGSGGGSNVEKSVSDNLDWPTVDYDILEFAHTLSSIPDTIRVVVVCVDSNFGYSVGDEIDFTTSIYNYIDGSFKLWTLSADATKIYIRGLWGNYPPYVYGTKSGGGSGNNLLNMTKWKIKIYAYLHGGSGIITSGIGALGWMKFDGTSSPSAVSILATSVNATTNVITEVDHGWVTGQCVRYGGSSGTPLGGVTVDTPLFVIKIDDDTFKLASTKEAAIAENAIDITTAGTGTHSLYEGLSYAGSSSITGVIKYSAGSYRFKLEPGVTSAASSSVTANSSDEDLQGWLFTVMETTTVGRILVRSVGGAYTDVPVQSVVFGVSI